MSPESGPSTSSGIGTTQLAEQKQLITSFAQGQTARVSPRRPKKFILASPKPRERNVIVQPNCTEAGGWPHIGHKNRSIKSMLGQASANC